MQKERHAHSKMCTVYTMPLHLISVAPSFQLQRALIAQQSCPYAVITVSRFNTFNNKSSPCPATVCVFFWNWESSGAEFQIALFRLHCTRCAGLETERNLSPAHYALFVCFAVVDCVSKSQNMITAVGSAKQISTSPSIGNHSCWGESLKS